MLRKWRKATVAELQAERALLVEDGNHGEQRPRHAEFGEKGVPFIRAADMDSGRILFHSASRINEVALRRIRKGIGKPGDVLLSHKGTVGKVAAAPMDCEPFVCSPQTTFWRVLDEQKINRRYLFSYLKSPAFTEQLDSRKGETDMADYVSLTTQRTLSVVLPPLPEQRAIATILGSLDDKIELNRRMNETLEALAQTLFKSWFIDPTRNGLPNGWREGTIRDLTSNIQYGLTQSASTEPVGPRFLRITDIQGGRVNWGTVPYCKVSSEDHERYRLQPNDILVARTGASTGENIYLPVAPDAVFASYLVRFQFEDGSIARFVGAFMRTQTYFDYVAGCIGGSAQPNASAQVLAGATLAVPPPELTGQFAEMVAPFDKRIAANNEESRTLAALRDALLPKLLAGELRVTGGRQFAEPRS